MGKGKQKYNKKDESSSDSDSGSSDGENNDAEFHVDEEQNAFDQSEEGIPEGEDEYTFPKTNTKFSLNESAGDESDGTKTEIFQATIFASLEQLHDGTKSSSTPLIKNKALVGVKEGEGLLLEVLVFFYPGY